MRIISSIPHSVPCSVHISLRVLQVVIIIFGSSVACSRSMHRITTGQPSLRGSTRGYSFRRVPKHNLSQVQRGLGLCPHAAHQTSRSANRAIGTTSTSLLKVNLSAQLVLDRHRKHRVTWDRPTCSSPWFGRLTRETTPSSGTLCKASRNTRLVILRVQGEFAGIRSQVILQNSRFAQRVWRALSLPWT
jgi:hypothetical protein